MFLLCLSFSLSLQFHSFFPLPLSLSPSLSPSLSLSFSLSSPCLVRLKLQCVEVEEKVHPVCPAFTLGSGACCLQKEPLLSSCAGAVPDQLRLCPCRGYRKGQVALCPHCL